jgi:hypothetical protein
LYSRYIHSLDSQPAGQQTERVSTACLRARGRALAPLTRHRARAQATGVEFPEVVSLWGASDKFRSVGAGVRAKKFAFVPVKARARACPPRLRRGWRACGGTRAPTW